MTHVKNGIQHDIIVEAGVTAAFEIFTAHLGEWWPLAYTFSGPDFAGASIDPAPGGAWGERNAEGEWLSWGEVRIYERGERLVLAFGIGPDRQPVPDDAASEVEVRFQDAGAGLARIQVEHRHFDRHGAGAAALRAGMDSPQGWPLILAALRRWIAARASVRYIVEDIDPAVAFYTSRLGFVAEIKAAHGFAVLSRGTIRLCLNEPDAGGGGQSILNGSTPHPGGWNRLQLPVANLDSEIRRLRVAGCSFRSDVVEGRGGRQILLSDPSGNLIELFEPFSRTSPPKAREREQVAD
jgi:uncharacterized protein YndB with AHSA1/START domain/catechol 2,3-dioxygenase-like lactoylglutathione lyase family enzyme